MQRTRSTRIVIVLATVLTLAAAAGEAWARAGSGGSRGSRSFSSPAPARPSPSTPAAPSRSPGSSMPSPAPRPSLFGGIMGAVGGFMLGGLLGSLLFGGFGGGFGVGMLDLLLIVGAFFLLFKLMQSRRREPAYAGAPGYAGGGAPRAWDVPTGGATVQEQPAVPDDLDRGLAHIRQMDPGFDAAALASDAAETFRAVQTALASGDLAPLRSCLAPEMLSHLQSQADALRRAGQTNRIERIQIGRAEVTEAWQERGQDFVTVLLAGSLIDYTVDAAGAVVAGSRGGPERFEDLWTFTRTVGPNAWTLTAIQTG